MSLDLLGLPLYMLYPLLALGLFVVMVTLVPREYIRKYFFAGLLWGTLGSWLFVLAAQGLNLFHYQHVEPFGVLEAPIWLNLAWAAAIVVFLYNRPPKEHSVVFWIYVVLFSFLSAAFDQTMNNLGLLDYIFWSPWARFCVAIPWLWGTLWFQECIIEGRVGDKPANTNRT